MIYAFKSIKRDKHEFCWSFQWLAVDRLKLMQEAKAFDGKKACWIPDAQDGYAPGEIQSTTGQHFAVVFFFWGGGGGNAGYYVIF